MCTYLIVYYAVFINEREICLNGKMGRFALWDMYIKWSLHTAMQKRNERELPDKNGDVVMVCGCFSLEIFHWPLGPLQSQILRPDNDF